MNLNYVNNIMKSYERIPQLGNEEQKPENKGLLQKKVSSMSSVKEEYAPLVNSVKSFQSIRKARMEILESRKNG